MKYLVVGAGISGLYTAYSLYKEFKTNDILIIEKDNRIGGKIYSLNLEFGSIEIGSGVILNNHSNTINLVHELGLQDKLLFSESLKSYAKLNFNENDGYYTSTIINLEKTGFIDIVKDLKNKINNKEIDLDLVKSYSLFRLIERIYGIETANKMNDEFGYDGDLRQNAINGIDMLINEVNTPIYFMKGGMIQIIRKLKKFLEDKGINIYLNTKCIDIEKYGNKYKCILHNNSDIETDNIILSIPKKSLCCINSLLPVREFLDSVFTKSLMRIYLIFPTSNDVWFENLNGIITTSTILRQIIPVDKKNGLLMIYIADFAAESLYYLKKNNKLKYEVMFHLRRIFNDMNIPDPIKIISKYWDEATHLWKPTYDSEILSNKIIQPFFSEKIYIVGESFSNTQQWLNGALETVNSLMKILS